MMFLAALCAAAQAAAAQPQQDPAQVDRAAREFLQRETRGLPGRVTIETATVDTRTALPACAKLQTFLPPGSRPWGQTSVGVRCAGPSPWSIYVAANVRVAGDYLVAARPLAAGQAIAAGDFTVQQGELTQLPAGVLTDAAQALGRQLANGIQAGQPLRRDAVREPPAIVAGQTVALVFNGQGFRVSSQGQALGKAPAGERVQVKTAGGVVVSGIARADAVVEVVR